MYIPVPTYVHGTVQMQFKFLALVVYYVPGTVDIQVTGR